MDVALGRQGNLVVHRDCRGVKGPDGLLIRDQWIDVGALRFWFRCPGCDDAHAFVIGPQHAGESHPRWTFNGDLQRPTFEPSLLVRYGDKPGDKRCHLYLRNGQLQFLGDCTHALAGKTVPIPDPPDWLT